MFGPFSYRFKDFFKQKIEMFVDNIRYPFIKRETITLAELQSIIEESVQIDGESITEGRKAELIEKGHVLEPRSRVKRKYPSYINSFRNSKHDPLIIKNLIIKVTNRDGLHISNLSQKKRDFNLLFENVIFESDKNTDYISGDLVINFTPTTNAVFLRNKCQNLNLEAHIEQEKEASTIDINRSNFSDLRLYISADKGKKFYPCKITLTKSIFKNLRMRDHIPAGTKETSSQKYILDLVNNKIESLHIHNANESNCLLSCDSGNRINSFLTEGRKPEAISWGLKEKIKFPKHKGHINSTREIFVAFKKQALEKKHKLHEVIFQNHINKCDAALIKLEPFLSSWQERIIMWLAKLFSNYGTSLWLPAFWLCLINLLIALTVTVLFESLPFANTSYLFFELFQPFKNINGIVNDFHNISSHDWRLSALTLVNKFFYAICAYEFIRAARRFTPR